MGNCILTLFSSQCAFLLSQICTRLAASGKVVLAIEHRDGSAHAIMSGNWETEKQSKRIVFYVPEKDATCVSIFFVYVLDLNLFMQLGRREHSSRIGNSPAITFTNGPVGYPPTRDISCLRDLFAFCKG